MSEPEILFEQRGAAGIVTLNRSEVLNAVTHRMVRALARKLEQWKMDAAVTRVVIRAAGERAFSSGGDLRSAYDHGIAGRQGEALKFWVDEYRLNVAIKRFPKPYVALIDGIVMGGGVGVSVHGSHRVAGDRYLFAMPEVGIGFFPDVGATYFLPRLPGEVGTFLALTGTRIGGADAIALGVATHRVPSARFSLLVEALSQGEEVTGTIAAFSADPGETKLLSRRTAIDRLFSEKSVEEILGLLDLQGDSASPDAEFARTQAATIRTKAPLSLKIALAQMRRGKHWSFEECMKTEFRIISRVVHGHDFYEGVRAVIIDKDNQPRWNPDHLEAVSEAMVEAHFEPLPPKQELAL